VRVRGPGLSDNISGTDPLKDKLPLRMSHPLDATPGTKKTKKITNSQKSALEWIYIASIVGH
jgi:hypothetical protein